MTTSEAMNMVVKVEYKLYEWKANGWDFIRDLTYDEANNLMNQWQDWGGYLDNDFGIVDQTVMFTHELLDRTFIMERV